MTNYLRQSDLSASNRFSDFVLVKIKRVNLCKDICKRPTVKKDTAEAEHLTCAMQTRHRGESCPRNQNALPSK